jgi:hypothetical protein
MAERIIVAIPHRTYSDASGRLIYSKVRPDMTDLPLAEAEGVLVHEWADRGHTFRIGAFANNG